MDPSVPLVAAEAAPAGGAAIDQVIGMTVGLTLAFGGLVVLGELHRRGRRTPLGTLAAFGARLSGMPRWAALPLGVAAIALIGAVVGYMWDVSLHIDKGRDDGPLANPSHYLILAGLYGLLASAYLSAVLTPRGDVPGRSAIRIGPDRWVPLGAVLIGAAALFAFAGFPLDDLWHRLFGQDVTLWGPTHLVMLSGGLMTLVGVVVLFEEGVAAAPHRAERDEPAPAPSPLGRLADLIPQVPVWPSRVLIAAAFLAGLSIYQGEFDYGVPQFQLALQPLLISISAGGALVAARIWIGRGGAIGAVALYLVIRGGISLLVGPILGETTPSFPLYLPEAICVELAALLLARRPLALGAVAGLAIGTAGFAGEWAWVSAAMPIEWTGALLPEGPILAALGGIAAGLVGALLGLALRRELPAAQLAAGVAVASLAVVTGCLAFGLADRNPTGVRADVALTEVSPAPEREVLATVRFEDDVAEGASWVQGIAWQGGSLVRMDLDRIGEGVYRTPEPLPVYGDWKAGFRVQNGRSVMGLELRAPADEAIPLPEVPALASFTRELRPDREILQRERDPDAQPWLWNLAALAVLAFALAFLGLLAWGIDRFSRGAPAPRPPRTPKLHTTTRRRMGT